MHDIFLAIFFVGLLLLPSTLGEYFLEHDQDTPTPLSTRTR